MQTKKQGEPTIISLGGSLIVPGEIDSQFLKKFNKLIRQLVADGQRFVIITGGGRTARNYQFAARSVVSLQDEDVDWLGVHATRINAHLIRTMFHDIAHPRIIKRPKERISWTESVLVAAGWKPGWSTDYCAVLIGRQIGATTVVNLSNISHVYSGDPKNDKTAKPFEAIDWKAYRKLIPAEWRPGLSTPFDPIASKLAEKSKIKVIIADGSDFSNIKKALLGLKFKGTTIL